MKYQAYKSIIRIKLIAGMQYRIAALAGVSINIFWGLILVKILMLFYKLGNHQQGGMTLSQGITYIWLAQCFLGLASLQTDTEVYQKITSGDFAYELLRPLDLYTHWYMRAAALRLSNTILKSSVALIVCILLPSPYGIQAPISIEALIATIFAFFCALLLSCSFSNVMNALLVRVELGQGITSLFYAIITVLSALEYGFETHNGFSKAFKKEFGFSPTQYLKRIEGYCGNKSILEFGGDFMNPTIIKKSAFKVAGYGIKTNITNGNYTKDVASFWINYEGENLESKMYEILNPPKHGEVGLCIPSSNDNGEATYLLGVIVDNFNDVTDNMITVEVPEATYAVFTTPPVNTGTEAENNEFANVIKQTWKYIFEEWFKGSGYIFDETKLDFEYYDERCHPTKDTVMDIYVPVLKKNV